jgi:S1-C subfamily serine protease
VSEVDPAGPSRLANLRINHVLLEINRHPVASIEEYRARVAALPAGASVALLVYDRATSQRIICTVVADPTS